MNVFWLTHILEQDEYHPRPEGLAYFQQAFILPPSSFLIPEELYRSKVRQNLRRAALGQYTELQDWSARRDNV